MFITILMLAILLTGLVLLATGVVVLLKAKNKIAGWVIVAIGLVFTLFSSVIFLMLTITTSTSSMG
jgi:hypothetical protein